MYGSIRSTHSNDGSTGPKIPKSPLFFGAIKNPVNCLDIRKTFLKQRLLIGILE
jgi:hypothetical protein